MVETNEVPPFHREDRLIKLDDLMDMIEAAPNPNLGMDPLDFADFLNELLQKSHTIEVIRERRKGQ